MTYSIPFHLTNDILLFDKYCMVTSILIFNWKGTFEETGDMAADVFFFFF